ncbi:MAG: hypothetical protein ACKVQQ_13375 [Burkholderiales bacterium]
MYAGHFAIGLAVKARFPAVPAVPIMLGTGFLDIMNGLFVLAGIDRVTPNPASGPYLFFDLTFIDWDHSLAAAVVLSCAWAALFVKNGKVAVIAGLVAFSHFLIDWPMHNHDLALYPHSSTHLGLGLWGSLGVASWALEGVLVAVLAAYAWALGRLRGKNLAWPCALLLLLFVQMSPWFSPMRHIASLGGAAAGIGYGALVLLGFLIPGLIFCWLLNRADRQAGS